MKLIFDEKKWFHIQVVFLWLVCCVISGRVYSQTEDTPGVFEKKLWTAPNGFALDYYTFKPDLKKPATGYPLVLALHGTEDMIDLGGEGSHLLNRETVKGWTEKQLQEKYKPYILAPQVSLQSSWGDKNVQQAINSIIQSLINEGTVDQIRIYVVGHSAGGAAAWLFPVNLDIKFAAIAPMSGFWMEDAADLPLAEAAHQIYRGVAIWNFHHSNDPGSGVAASRNIINILEANDIEFTRNSLPEQFNLGNKYLYTEYTAGTLPCSGVSCHQICDVAIKDPVFVEWLFRQKRTNDPVTALIPDKLIQDFILYPNPVQDVLNLKGNERYLEGAVWQILNMQGKVMLNGRAEGSLIQTHFLPAGTYILEINPGTIPKSRYQRLFFKL